MLVDKLQPGTRVRVTQTIHRRDTDWHTSVIGEVISCGPEKTGSWFVHHHEGKLMLTRLRLRKDDGELTTLTLDQRSLVEILPDGGGA